LAGANWHSHALRRHGRRFTLASLAAPAARQPIVKTERDTESNTARKGYAMKTEQIEVPLKCAACGQNRHPSSARPDLCRACAEAAKVVEIIDSHGTDLNVAHYDLIVEALEALRNDATAFVVIRRFTALLNADVAAALFLDRSHQLCLEP
jgi:hypothetical protein